MELVSLWFVHNDDSIVNYIMFLVIVIFFVTLSFYSFFFNSRELHIEWFKFREIFILMFVLVVNKGNCYPVSFDITFEIKQICITVIHFNKESIW